MSYILTSQHPGETHDGETRSELLRSTLLSIGDGVIATDALGLIRFMNPIAEGLTGWPERDAIGRRSAEVFRIVDEETRTPVESPVDRVIREGTIVGLANHTILIARDGTERPIDDSGAPIRDSEGKLIGTIVVFRDISERRRAEIQTAQLAAIVQSSEDAIYTKTLEGIITSWNPAAERMYGYKANEIVGQSVNLLVPPDRPNEVPDFLARIARGERIDHYETERIAKDGRRIFISKSISPLRNSLGEVVGASSIARDISQSLLQKQEIEALNRRLQRAMKETHHRIKNSLQVIAALINVQMLDNQGVVPVSALKRVAQHVSSLAAIHDLLTQENNHAPPSQSVSVLDVLDKLIPMLEAMLGGRRIQMDIEDAELPVRHVTALTILVNELVSNAIKHGAGTITVSLSFAEDRARLQVTDEGRGFPEETQIDGAASTGLELIRTVAQWDMAGRVTIGNRPEGGACVAVDFPVPTGDQ